jgi:hypothetical protein
MVVPGRRQGQRMNRRAAQGDELEWLREGLVAARKWSEGWRVVDQDAL